MKKKINGLSLDLIIHPGETLEEVLANRSMTQKDLSLRTGFSEKHISNVVHGYDSISPRFAIKLEYVFSIDASFWINLQTKYDQERMEFEEISNVSDDEIGILRPLKPIINFFTENGFMTKSTDNSNKVIELRQLLEVSNLTLIPNLSYNACYRKQASNSADIYVVYAWQKICEIMTERESVAAAFNRKELHDRLPEIKKMMFCEPNEARKRLKDLFAECGIIFEIVPHFRGAPVQGFIKKIEMNKIILCLTLRQKYADIFWFTLFHEIGHLLNGDLKKQFIDFESVESDIELLADKFAQKCLIGEEEYNRFIENKDFSLASIKQFARRQSVQPFIVIGRLQREKIIPYSKYVGEKTRYEWST